MSVILTLIVSAIVCVFVFILGRTGGERRLRSAELTLLLATVFVAGLFLPLALYAIGFAYTPFLLLVPAIQLAIGLIWIRARRGFLVRPSVSTLPLAATHIPSATSFLGSPGSPLILLSYRRDASGDVTGRIYDRLVQHFGQDSVFKDVDSIPLGIDFRQYLSDSVAQCQVLLAVVGERWLGRQERGKTSDLDNPRDFVRIEIESALQRRVPVIPILVQGAQLPQEDELPTSLRILAYYNAIAVRPDPDFSPDMARLIKGIEHHLSKKAQQQ